MATDGRAQAWITLGMLAACNAVAIIDRFGLSLLVEPIKADLGLNDAQIGIIMGPAFAVMYGCLGIPLGWLADTQNRRNLAASAIAFWSLCTLAMGFAVNYASMLVTRAFVGAGEAALTPAAYSMLGDRFDRGKLGRVMAILTLGANAGAIIGFVGGGLLFAAFAAQGRFEVPFTSITLAPWQMTLAAFAAPGFVLAAMLMVFVKEPVRSARHDKAVSFAKVLAHIWGERGFYLPVLGAYTCLSAMMFGVFAWAPAYQMRAYGLSVAEVGGIMGLVVQVPGLLSPLIVGAIVDRMFKRYGPIGGMFAMRVLLAITLVAGLVAFLADTLVVTMVGLACFAFFGVGMFVLTPAVLQAASPPQMRGRLAAIQLLCGNLIALSLGPMIVALLTQHVFGEGGLGLALAWHVGAFCALGLVCALAVRSVDKPAVAG